METGAFKQPGGHSLQLEFQDSNMSPAFSLLPVNSGVGHGFTDYSLVQQSDSEFAPLRAYPDDSVASEKFNILPRDQTTCVSDCGSLTQLPLGQTEILSDGGSNGFSISQHSLSPGDQSRREEVIHPPMMAAANEKKEIISRDYTDGKEEVRETQINASDKPVGEASEDETLFLSKDVSVQHLMKILQKDVGMSTNSSSAASSETSGKRTGSFTEESKFTKVCKLVTDQSIASRECPPGEASFPPQQAHQPNEVLNQPVQQQTLSLEVCNITMGSRSTKPDNDSEVLRRELLSEVERCKSSEGESKNTQQPNNTTLRQSLTEQVKAMSEGKPSVVKTNMSGAPLTGPFSAGVERVHREHDLWSSGNQTGIDGSYLNFLPQSQSTPGVFNAPPESTVKVKLGTLSSIQSIENNSYHASRGNAPQPLVPVGDTILSDTTNQLPECSSSAKVQSLPSLNYMQKVDAWRANHSSGNTSLFDSLALQGFSGISPKKKAYDAVSDHLNRILSQQIRSVQQPPVSEAANHSATQTSSATASGSSSPRRGEAVGSAPSDKDNTGATAPPSASPCGRSQSHSSLSTVVMSVQKDQQTERRPEAETTHCPDPTSKDQTPPHMSLGHFSDVSLDRDLTLSSSQDSHGEIKLGTSIGASSVSLELDNYVPYWNSKPSTPPLLLKPRELNIDERIPLYLHNLGIDQSPATILTPFAPRGPIREPEFSPTEFCTLKGSTGTPTKSTHPSEGGSPHKGEFSMSSILSVDSSISIPHSLDSLGPAVSIPEWTRQTLPASDTEVLQSECRLACNVSLAEYSCSTSPPCQQQKDESLISSANITQLENKFGSDASLMFNASHKETILESHMQRSHSLNQSTQASFVDSRALLEIHKLVSHAETVLATGSSASFSASPSGPCLLSDQDISLKKKTSRLQDSSLFSTSMSRDPRTHPSLLWSRSSSDLMLTSEKQRQGCVGLQSKNSSWQPSYQSTQALITGPSTVTYSDSTIGDAGTSLVPSKSARRTEPEGCNAAPPDKVSTQLPVIQTSPAVSTQQLISAETAANVEEEGLNTPISAGHSSSSLVIFESHDQEVMSDGSSESSLGVRVATLLQSASPATMVSSTPSNTDQEESKAREWIKLKLSGQHCEPLQLDEEDRRQIDKIKRELLLKNPMNNLQSTDTESSAASSVKVSRECNPSHSAEACSDNNQPVQGLYATPPSSSTQRQIGPRPALEAQVCEIAAREGVTLPIKKPQTLTSITITTRRRSTSPSPSTSPAPPFSPTPDPLHLTELSRETDQPTAAKQDEEGWVASAKVTSRESPSVSERGSSSAHSRKRQDTLGGQYEEPLPPFQRGVLKKHESPQDFRQDNKIYVQNTSASASFVKSSVTTGHVSHVHFTVSPKAPVKTVSTDVDSSHPTTTSRLPCEEFTSLRCSSTATSSPDEGVGLSSLPEWCNAKESVIRHQSERSLHSSMFKTVVPKGRPTSMSTETFTPHHRSETPPRTFTTETPVPVLLPYKPPGSEELFYIPQTEADFSSTEQSDTTMESTHTGSDDAVPPNFGSEVLGHQDPGVDRGVTIRHTEGIYSKRQKTAAFTMQEPGHKAADKSPSNISPSPSSTTETLMSNDALKMDQGTSPVHFLQNEPEPTLERLQPVSKEADYDKGSSHLVPQKDWEQGKSSPGLLQPATQQNSLDQLWQKFCDSWTMEESRPTRDRESSLLERLERLSRLIHSTRAAAVSQVQKEVYHHPEQKHGRGEEETLRRMERMEAFEEVKRGGRKDDPPLSLKHQVEETSQCVEGDSHASSSSSFSLSSSQSQHLSPADRDESETLSTVSGSMSTVDTARLVQAFGADKIQHLKTKSSLSKLYSNIDRQKEGRQQRRGRHSDSPAISMLSETMDTDVSVAADTSSTSTYTLPPHQGPSRTLECKRAVRVANKSIQAGELEIVRNGTRRHTRDVGTVFPSPGESGQISSNSSNTVRGRGSQRSPSKAQIGQKQRKSRKSPLKPYPEGVSWFIPADDLRSEARKENKPMQGPSVLRRNTAWFEPYSKVNSWREPLRQRQIHEDGCEHQPEPHPDPTAKTYSGLIVSLQEALERHRPEFISRSRQRVKRLALQVEERKLQTAFTRNREVFVQLGEPERLPRPAGAALLRRAVPRKEMIWRSKQIYDNLPEVRWRREEERRKADYQTYRLNAQLYNRRITNRVLGRRSAWQ
ncbi:uncharacterized protein alms1 isoform 2-T2 [Pholidichthys leucotaenia]